MRRFVGFAGIAIAVVVVAAVTVRSQEPSADQDPAAMMEAFMKYASPGPEHEALAPLVGDFDVKLKVFMAGPGGPAMESDATASARWVLGKRFVQQEASATLMGMPWDSITMTGYDRGKQQYVSSSANSMDTQMTILYGSRHRDSGDLVFYGPLDEPAISVFGRPIRNVIRFNDDGSYVVEVYDLHVGEDYKVVEMHYTPKKKADDAAGN